MVHDTDVISQDSFPRRLHRRIHHNSMDPVSQSVWCPISMDIATCTRNLDLLVPSK